MRVQFEEIAVRHTRDVVGDDKLGRFRKIHFCAARIPKPTVYEIYMVAVYDAVLVMPFQIVETAFENARHHGANGVGIVFYHLFALVYCVVVDLFYVLEFVEMLFFFIYTVSPFCFLLECRMGL